MATPPRKQIDEEAAGHIVRGYMYGGYIDLLVQEVYEQGYVRLDYHEVAANLANYGLQLSLDRVFNEENKPAVEAAMRATEMPALQLQFFTTGSNGDEQLIEDAAEHQRHLNDMFSDERASPG